MNKAWAFYRRSTDKQELSIPDQRAACIKKAGEMNAIITCEFVPLKSYASGKTIEKDSEFQRMAKLAEANDHGVKLIFVHDVSRFGRMPPQSKFYWQEHFRRHGIQIIYAVENFKNDGSLGDDVQQLVSHGKAHQFSIDLGRDTIRGSKSHAGLGHSCGGSAPYGYDRLLIDQAGQPVRVLKDGERKSDKLQRIKWTPAAAMEVETLRWIFESYAKGNGLRAIVNELNRRRVPSPRGKKWGKLTIRTIVRNVAYLGTRVYFKWNYHPSQSDANQFKHARPESDWIVTPGAHEPLISQELFDRAQARIRVNKPGAGRTGDSPHILSGLILCGHCKRRFLGQYKQHEGKKVRYYLCSGYHNGGPYVCESLSIAAEFLEGIAYDEIQKKVAELKDEKVLRAELRRLLGSSASDREEAKKKAMEDSIRKIEKDLQNLMVLAKAGRHSPTLLEEINKLEQEKGHIETERLKLTERHRGLAVDTDKIVKQALNYFDMVPALLARGAAAERRAVMGTFVDGIEIDPKGRRVKFRLNKMPIKEIAGSIGAGDTTHRERCGGWI